MSPLWACCMLTYGFCTYVPDVRNGIVTSRMVKTWDFYIDIFWRSRSRICSRNVHPNLPNESCTARYTHVHFPLFVIKDDDQWRHVQSIYNYSARPHTDKLITSMSRMRFIAQSWQRWQTISSRRIVRRHRWRTLAFIGERTFYPRCWWVVLKWPTTTRYFIFCHDHNYTVFPVVDNTVRWSWNEYLISWCYDVKEDVQNSKNASTLHIQHKASPYWRHCRGVNPYWKVGGHNIYGVGSRARFRAPGFVLARRCSLVQSSESEGWCSPLTDVGI